VHSRFGPIPAWSSVLLIVLLAAVLRAVFFVGLVSGDPQDDGVYYGNAFGIYRNGPAYFELFRHDPPGTLANPIDQFHLRPMIIYPIAAMFAVFGPGEIPAALWAFVCSLATVLVVYRLGAVLHDHHTGLLAALLCAWYPLEIVNATRILSDVQVGLFFGLGLLLMAEGQRRQRWRLYVFAGMCAAAAYLANARGLIALGVLSACAAVQAARSTVPWRAVAGVLAGFLVIFAAEASIYYWQTGDPFLNYRIHAEAAQFKYLHEPVETLRWWRVLVRYTNGEPLELTRTVFVWRDLPTAQFGLYFFLFAGASLVSAWRRRNGLLLLVSVAVFAFLEFGPVRVGVDPHAGELQYSMIYKQARFLLILTAPLVVIAADALRACWQRIPAAAALVAVLLLATSITSTMRTRAYYRSGLEDLRSAAGFVRRHPELVFWSDTWAVEHLRIFSGYTARDLRVLVPSTPIALLRGSCLVLGGSRGVELLASYVEATYPPLVREVLRTGIAPADWRLVQEVKGKATFQRARDLRVYCVP
jgi:4-amino-4-deoxy-L-arabinose transferase-like glycosyltransferase